GGQMATVRILGERRDVDGRLPCERGIEQTRPDRIPPESSDGHRRDRWRRYARIRGTRPGVGGCASVRTVRGQGWTGFGTRTVLRRYATRNGRGQSTENRTDRSTCRRSPFRPTQ